MNLQQLRATINRLQDLDSFPVNSENQLHKIVKKQMAVSDYQGVRKSKRSALVFPERLKGRGSTEPDRKEGIAEENGAEDLAFPSSRNMDGNTEFLLKKLSKDHKNKETNFPRRPRKNEETETVEKTLTIQAEERKEERKEEMKEDMKEEKANEVMDMEIVMSNEPAQMKQETVPTEKPALTDLKKMEKDRRLKGLLKARELLNAMGVSSVKTEKKIEKPLLDLEQLGFDMGLEEELKQVMEENKKVRELLRKDKANSLKTEKKNNKSGERLNLTKNENINEVEKEEEDTKLNDEKLERENPLLTKQYRRIPDEKDFRFYYECEARPNGCMKLRHKRCPQGEYFSIKFLKCLKVNIPQSFRAKKSLLETPSVHRMDVYDVGPEDPEPSNEWLDATQGMNQKIPPEFKPKKKPTLKIYHLRIKRKLGDRAEGPRSANGLTGGKDALNQKGDERRSHNTRHHTPRSFIIRVNKKEEKEGVAEDDYDEGNEESEEDDDEADDEEEEDDDDEEEEEESEEEEGPSPKEKPKSSQDSLKEFLKSAKEAVTSRARFQDLSADTGKPVTDKKAIAPGPGKKKNAQLTSDAPTKDKKVLIDANIRVDSTISSVLKNFLKSKRKDSLTSVAGNDEALISDRGSQDQLDPELLRMYEHLMRNNPRIKRYFMANRGEGDSR